MDPDVAFAQRAENSVGDGVGQRVGIRMALGTAVRTDVHASQYKRPPFNQSMRVVADADPDHSSCKSASASSKSRGVVILIFLALPSTIVTGCPSRSTSTLSSVRDGSETSAWS